MADHALQKAEEIQKNYLQSEYGGKLSNQFVDQLKASTLFQFDWSELLTAAPAALSTLVCQIGGKQAFTTAGRNMDALCITSKRICDERIALVFAKLGPVTQSQENLEDFKDALSRLVKDATECSRLAQETREAFNKWGLMCSELQSCTEAEITSTAIKREAVKIDEEMAVLEQQFSTVASKKAEEHVKEAARQVAKAEKRLDAALNNVPGPWQSLLQTAVTGWTQAVPHLVAGVVPAILAASNPLAGAALALRGPNTPTPNTTDPNVSGGPVTTPAPTIQDPAYTTATAIRGQVSHFYDYLGGDKGAVDWTKFTKASEDTTAVSGIVYLLGNFTGQKTNLDVTNTEPNKKIVASLDTLIKVATEIREHLSKQNDMAAPDLDDAILATWKRDVKGARIEIITLATVDGGMSSNKIPLPFAKIDVPKADLSAQTAQTNAAMQGVSIAQAADDLAANKYQEAIVRQAKTAAALSSVDQKLRALQSTGKTLEQIKSILRDAISILVDLSVQIGKIEQFFVMLATVIDHIIMPRVRDLEGDVGRAGERGFKNRVFRLDEMAQQAIYITTLQLKCYFSLLQDIAGMYTEIHRKYILRGMELCSNLSKNTANSNLVAADQQTLADYSEKSAAEVNKLVKAKQDEVLDGLRARAKKAAAETGAIAAAVASSDLAVDSSARLAVEAGKQAVKKEAEAVLNAAGEPLTQSKQIVDANSF